MAAQGRDTRGTGLVEGFPTYDTGHDNSPRWKGVPGAARMRTRRSPSRRGVRALCDLGAVYGGRIALAAMARMLGKHDEAARWEQDAETLRRLILTALRPAGRRFLRSDADNNPSACARTSSAACWASMF
jgi:hypothetical protein